MEDLQPKDGRLLIQSLPRWIEDPSETDDLKTKGQNLEAHDPESRKNRSLKTRGNPKMRTLNTTSFLLLYFLLLDISSSPVSLEV